MLRHLQRLPGPHQAGSGALRQDHRHRRELPHPDLQHHRPPPVPDRPHPGGLQPIPLARQTQRWATCTACPSPTARAASWPPRSLIRPLAANGQIATQYVDLEGRPTVRRALQPQRLRLSPSRASRSPDGRVLRQDGPRRAHRLRPVQKRPRQLRHGDVQSSAVEYFK